MIRRLSIVVSACLFVATAASAEPADSTYAVLQPVTAASVETDAPSYAMLQPTAYPASSIPTDGLNSKAVSTDQKSIDAASQNKWQFALVLYGWGLSVKGDVGAFREIEPIGIDVSFGELLDHLKLVFMGAAEARHDRLIFLGDLFWAKLGADKNIEIRDREFLSGSITDKTLLATALAGYRAVEKGPVTIDLLGGARINGAYDRVRISGPNRTLTGTLDKKWVVPVIATRINAPLGGKVSATLYGDVGGLSGGSNSSWQGLATLNYQISRKTRVGAGYRYYKVNYRSGGFVYDVKYLGPTLVFRIDL